MICPSCQHKNLEGVDHCEECHASLHEQDQMGEGGKEQGIQNPISVLQPHKTISVLPETPVRDVIAQMKENNSGCALVVQGNKLEGIFTERDLLKKIAGWENDLSQREVSGFMTPSPEALKPDDSLAYAVNKMSMGSFRHVPIQGKDGDFYMISVRDILNYLF